METAQTCTDCGKNISQAEADESRALLGGLAEAENVLCHSCACWAGRQHTSPVGDE